MSDMWTEKMLYNVSAYIYTNIFCFIYPVSTKLAQVLVQTKYPDLIQENWFQSGTNFLLVLNKEPLTSGAGGRVITTKDQLKL